MDILKLKPAVKDYIWGGNRLTTEFDYVSFLDRQAEAWVLSCHKDGENIIENGEFEGRSLQEIIKEHPEYMGENGRNKEDFPILIKLIDAKDNLSVQVHPDDKYAREFENENGKTEAWYVLKCDEGASLIYGVNHDMTKDEFASAIENGTLLDDMNQSFVRWYSDAVYEVMCGIFRPYSTPGQYEVMCSVRDDYMKMNGRETVFAMKPDEFEDRLVAVAPENGFGMIYEANSVAVDEAYEREARITSCFETVFMYSISLPGRYVDGNALDFVEGNPVWKVDAFRLMCGDLTLEATSRKMNVWILILTFAVIAGVLQIFAKTYSRR